MRDEKCKIGIVFNHFQFQDGVARSAIAVANTLAKREDVEVTLIPLFKFHKDALSLVDDRVKIKPFLKFYFRGMQKIVDLIPSGVLYRAVIRDKYDIEIGFCMKTPIKMIASSKNADAKHYVWMHGWDDGLSLEKYYEKADKLVCVSRENAERVARASNANIDVDYAYNPIDDEDIVRRGKEPMPVERDDCLTFVTVGRQSAEKGFSRLIKVFKKLCDNGYRAKLWLIGDGAEHDSLVAEAKEYELEDRVIFFGAQKNPHAFTSKADIFVCSSYNEGYSTACTEALILGVPVITTVVGGAREIIETSEAGLLVKNNDDALYEGMQYALDHPEKVAEWKCTVKTTGERFSNAQRSKKLFEVLGL